MKLLPILLVVTLAAASCTRTPEGETSGSEPTPTPTSTDTIHVTGTVVSKDDKVPADGGVTLIVQPESGDAITFEFESLFTLPSPTPERQALYQKLVPINSGDRVRVVATRKDGGLRLEDIEKVP